jgi:TolB-like protein/Tfp pilus assembly protein PilF
VAIFEELKRRNVIRVGAAYAVISWLLIQVAETIFPLFGFDETPARVVVIVLAIGFIPALVVSWAFELTPEGIKRERDVDRGQDRNADSGRRMDRFISVALALALGFLAFDRFVLDPARDAEIAESARQQGRADAMAEARDEQSIAVLPFANLSPDPDQAYFADGVTEELLSLLAQVPGLRVTSRASAFAFRGEGLDLGEVAQKLNVTYILLGSVRMAGDRVRVTVRLLDPRSDTHLWSETYDGRLEDVFALQDDVAARITDQLSLRLAGRQPRANPVNPRAYTRFLEARQLMSLAAEDRFERAQGLLQEALELQPDYVDALVLMAEVHAERGWHARGAERDRAEHYARHYRQRALEVDPENPPALSAQALEIMNREGDLQSAARLLERALQEDPRNFTAVWAASLLAVELGQLELAARLLEWVVQHDPLTILHHHSLANVYSKMGRHDEALQQQRIAMSLVEREGAFEWAMGMARLQAGDASGALENFSRCCGEADEEGLRRFGQVLALHDLGREEESRAVLGQLQQMRDSSAASPESGGNQMEQAFWALGLGRLHAYLGDHDAAFTELGYGAGIDPTVFVGLGHDALLRNLHDDPRWEPLLQSLGQSPEQLAEIAFNPTLPH